MFYYAITNLWINVHSYKYICKPMSSGPEQHCSRIFIYLHLDGQRDPGTKKKTIFDFFLLQFSGTSTTFSGFLNQFEKKMPMVQLSFETNSTISPSTLWLVKDNILFSENIFSKDKFLVSCIINKWAYNLFSYPTNSIYLCNALHHMYCGFWYLIMG